jgi:ATP-binding cassette, subfamily C (CFTR/MRP), member 1
VLIFGFPLQFVLILIIVKQRQKGVKITDKRVRLTTEVLQGIRLIKMYGWEAFYYQQITNFREKEIKTVRKSSYGLYFAPYFMCIITLHIFLSFAVAWLVGLFSFLPVLASLLSFVSSHLPFL